MPFEPTLANLKRLAIAHSLFEAGTLADAIARLGFVQADPIRSPARAQDLILRQRVRDYRAGALEAQYPSLDIEEDRLYLYGFLPRSTWELLHPRKTTSLTKLERDVLEFVRARGSAHPRDLEGFGRRRVVNDWGGNSIATTRVLARLHYLGLVRIARRERGVRVFEPARVHAPTLSLAERVHAIVRVFANLLAPVPQRTLQTIAMHIRRTLASGGDAKIVAAMIRSGELRSASLNGVGYAWPASAEADAAGAERESERVRILAPFDPVVWDRTRFAQFWGWPYRFEAYVPPPKRVRGYYAMPLLWRGDAIGWANLSLTGRALDVDLGFVAKQPRERAFREALEAELDGMRAFLGLRTNG